MQRPSALAFVAILASPTLAQQATLLEYGGTCAPTWSINSNWGLPSLGSGFTVGFSGSPCQPYCPPTYWLVGASAVSTPLSIPGVTVHGCPLLVSPFTIVPGASLTVTVPNNPGLLGLRLYFQRASFWFGNPDVSLSLGVEATVGV